MSRHFFSYQFRTAYLVIGLVIILTNLQGQSSTKKITIENANVQEIILEEDPPKQILIGDVRAYHEGAFFYCDSAVLVDNSLFAYGNVIIIKNDSVTIFGDSMRYKGEKEMAYLDGNVILENLDEKLFTPSLIYNLATKKAQFYNKAELHMKDAIVKSQTGDYNTDSKLARFYTNVSVDGDQFRLVNDSLYYYMDSKLANWYSPTLINQDSSTIYSENGYYDLDDKNALFTQNVEIKEKDKTTLGDSVIYDEATKTIDIIGNAIYITETDTTKADRIIYNKETEISQLLGNATYKSPDTYAEGDEIIQDKKNGSYKLAGESTISDPPMIITAQNIDYATSTKKGIFIGDVLWQDTSAKIDIVCDTLDYDGSIDFAKAYGKELKPMMTSYSDDTVYISADTLINTKMIRQIDSVTTDTIKYLIGDNDVKIFNKDYQAISDTLAYNLTDSLFLLSARPLLWQDSTQMSGDSIKMQIKYEKIHTLHIEENGFIINSPDLIFFNQIKGSVIDIDFKENKIDKMKVNKNAQNIYYMMDEEDGYIGVNTTDCSLIIYQFQNGDIDQIRHYTAPDSKILPMSSTDHEALKLSGFNWNLRLRPSDPLFLRLE